MLDKARQKYGEEALLSNAEEASSSSSSSDDSEAELLNERVESKFLQVISAIRSKDKDKINKLAKGDPNANIFDDDDFDTAKGQTTKDKKYTLKDQIREHALRKMSDSSVSSSDDEQVTAKRDPKSDLFTKKGVPLAD